MGAASSCDRPYDCLCGGLDAARQADAGAGGGPDAVPDIQVGADDIIIDAGDAALSAREHGAHLEYEALDSIPQLFAKAGASAGAKAVATEGATATIEGKAATIEGKAGTQTDFNARMFAHHFGDSLVVRKGPFGRRPSSVGLDLDSYLQRHKAKFAKVLELEKPDGWQFCYEQQTVQVYKKVIPGTPLIYFKGVSDFLQQGSLAEFVTKIMAVEHRPKWDEMCTEGVMLQSFPPYYRVTQAWLKAPVGIISPREILLVGRMCMQPDGALVSAVESVDIPGIEPRPGYVRCRMLEGGFVFRPLDETGTNFRVTWTGCADPGGWIPQWVGNIIAPKQAMSLALLKVWLSEGGPSKAP